MHRIQFIVYGQPTHTLIIPVRQAPWLQSIVICTTQYSWLERKETEMIISMTPYVYRLSLFLTIHAFAYTKKCRLKQYKLLLRAFLLLSAIYVLQGFRVCKIWWHMFSLYWSKGAAIVVGAYCPKTKKWPYSTSDLWPQFF